MLADYGCGVSRPQAKVGRRDNVGCRLKARQLSPRPIDPKRFFMDEAMAQSLGAEPGDAAGLSDEMALV